MLPAGERRRQQPPPRLSGDGLPSPAADHRSGLRASGVPDWRTLFV